MVRASQGHHSEDVGEPSTHWREVRDSMPMNLNEVNLNINKIGICPAINVVDMDLEMSFIFYKWYCKVSVNPSITPQGCWGDLARTAGVPSASAAERQHGA